MPDAHGKAKRINITMPEEILRRVDAAAKSRGLSRSSYLTRAAQEVMEGQAAIPQRKKGKLLAHQEDVADFPRNRWPI